MTDSREQKLEKIRDELEEGLRFQVEAYEEMLRLVQKQNELIQENKFSELSKLIQAKNGVLKRIERAESTILPILKRWQDIKSEFPRQTVERVEEQFRNARDLLAKIIQLESEMESYAEELMDETSSKIEELVRARDAQKSYDDPSSEQAKGLVDRNE